MHSAPRRSARPPRPRGDKHCPTCSGTGRFVPVGKSHEVPVRCPRCRGEPSVHAVPPASRALLQHFNR